MINDESEIRKIDRLSINIIIDSVRFTKKL